MQRRRTGCPDLLKTGKGDRMAYYFIADTHFGHENILAFDKKLEQCSGDGG